MEATMTNEVEQYSNVETYVSMADDDSVAVSELGQSPSELHHPVALPPIWVGHQGCPEMDLTNVYDVVTYDDLIEAELVEFERSLA
jgi:hypothetical protein